MIGYLMNENFRDKHTIFRCECVVNIYMVVKILVCKYVLTTYTNVVCNTYLVHGIFPIQLYVTVDYAATWKQVAFNVAIFQWLVLIPTNVYSL